jgi:hypothetical protein
LLEDSTSHGGRRRVLPNLKAHDIWFTIRRPGNQLEAELTLAGPFGDLWRRAKDLRGVGVAVTPLAPSRARLTLSETRSGQSDLFQSLVTDLVANIDPAGREPSLDRVLVRLEAWQRFFALGPMGLSLESQLGLYGELRVLIDLVAPAFGPEIACKSWTGPDPAIQDFQLEQASIEVKSTRAAQPVSFQVSSERQLDATGAGQLLLVLNVVDAREDGPGETLQHIVESCRKLVSDKPEGAMALDDSLLSAGYLDAEAARYSTRYTLRQQSVFVVDADFPSIVPSMLPLGVASVRYRIAADACVPWRVSTDEAIVLLAGRSTRDEWLTALTRPQGTTPPEPPNEPPEPEAADRNGGDVHERSHG